MEATAGITKRLYPQQWDDPLFAERGLDVSVLRLDVIHPVLSGNKWLKLNGWLHAFHAGNYKGIISFGGPWSNHIHALAYACQHERIPCLLYVKGSLEETTATLNDCRAWGAEISFYHGSTSQKMEEIREEAAGLSYLIVPMGGDGPEGLIGVTEYFRGLDTEGLHALWTAVGTGTTLLGIADAMPPHVKLHGFLPGINPDQDQMKRMREFANIELVMQDGRFGKITPEIVHFMLELREANGIPLDAVYTARMFQFFRQRVAANLVAPQQKIILVHTGGLQGNRSEAAIADFYVPGQHYS